MHIFLLTHGYLISITLLLIAFLCVTPVLINGFFFLRYSSRDYVMDVLKHVFPYDGDITRFKNPDTGNPYEVSRPRNFKNLNDEEIREKILDFNASFVRNKLSVTKA